MIPADTVLILLSSIPLLIRNMYLKKIFVCGYASHDWVCVDGKVHDSYRIDYLTRYLRGYRRAAEEGVPLIGYLQWSLMDNYEWSQGYTQRFGMIYVDYPTQKRTIKDSGYWYKNIIETNGEAL